MSIDPAHRPRTAEPGVAPDPDALSQVLYVVDQYPSTSETFIANEIAELRRRGIAIDVIALERPSAPAPHAYARQEEARTLYLSELSVLNQLWLALKVLRSPLRTWRVLRQARQRSAAHAWAARRSFVLAGLLSTKNAPHVHVHFAGVAAMRALPAARMARKSFTLITHGYDVLRAPMPELGAFINATDGCIAVAEHMRAVLKQEHGVRPDLISRITCGVDTQFFEAAPPPANTPVTLLTVARLSREKNLTLAINIARALADRGIAFTWNIIGEGPERKRLEAMIQDLSLSAYVTLLGARSSDDVRSALAHCDVFVLTSASEAAGVVLIEAMASERPVVAPKVGGITEIVRDGTTGLVIENGDAEVFADALQQLLLEAPTRAAMGKAGRSHVIANLSLARQVDQLLAVWEQAATRDHARDTELA